LYVGKDFHPSDSGEDETYAFDFVKDLDDGETLVTSTWYCTVADDSEEEDSDAPDHIVLSASIEGSVTKQRISGLQANVKYVLQAVVTTNFDNTRSLWSHVLCRLPH